MQKKITIYHNARCQKSRTALKVLEERGVKYIVREYLKDPLSIEELKYLLGKMDVNLQDVIRKNEKEFKEHFKGKELSDSELIEAICNYPKLLQRPILESEKYARITRSVDQVEEMLENLDYS